MTNQSASDAIVDHFKRLIEMLVRNDMDGFIKLMDTPPKGVKSGTGSGYIDATGNVIITDEATL